jgi:hypothetical protein
MLPVQVTIDLHVNITSVNRRSAGILSPVDINTTSPGTNSLARKFSNLPFLMLIKWNDFVKKQNTGKHDVACFIF